MTTTDIALIIVAAALTALVLMAATAVVTDAVITRHTARTARPEPQPEPEPEPEPYPAQPRDTDKERRRLATGWPQRIGVPVMPELGVPVLVRPYVAAYVGHHNEDTIDLRLVAPDWMPPIGAARLRAVVGDTEQMAPVR